jgi:hypothetical protein
VQRAGVFPIKVDYDRERMRALYLIGVLVLVSACSGPRGGTAPARDGQVSEDAGAITALTDAAMEGSDAAPARREKRVFLALGADLPPAIGPRVRTLLSSVPWVLVLDANDAANLDGLEGTVLALGDHPIARAAIADSELTNLMPEGFVTRVTREGAVTVLAARGLPAAQRVHENLGAAHGAYALLENLGFGFLHPLTPVLPLNLTIPLEPSVTREQPRWPERTFHLHTQHPLELTELLQGFGEKGPEDEAGFLAMLPELDSVLEWLVANRQNGLEWFLLWAESWAEFADSEERLARLTMLVDRAHAFGLAAGIDAPIAFAQQHSYRLLREQGELDDELAQIRTRLDFLARAGWDFYGIEMGTSEFTAPPAERMLAWMNEVVKHLDEAHGRRAYVKVHCSAGQKVDAYQDPVTPGPLDFNFLPHYADPRLGVLPHTVQHYALDDRAPTYGNQSFERVHAFAAVEAGARPVVFYPETAYWVSFDVDVPLFLPLYAERRLHDLRLLARDEDGGALGRGEHAHSKLDGQLVFSSGWEWGYWLNDLLAARAAWDPGMELASDQEALDALLAPVTRLAGEHAQALKDWLHAVVLAEQALLIDGKVRGSSPSDIVKRNGQAYLQGWDTWDDVSSLANGLSSVQMTQPDKLGLVDLRNPSHAGPAYAAEVEPLLAEMANTFRELHEQGEALRAQVQGPLTPYLSELVDAMHMTALRARQVHGLYDYVATTWDVGQGAFRAARLKDAQGALDEALNVVKAREAHYRVSTARITAWRQNPTAYAFTYLWTVHSLFYWWRDEGKAVEAPLSPCYRNIINPVDVALGEGTGTDAARMLGELLSSGDQRGCLAEPAAEPTFSR